MIISLIIINLCKVNLLSIHFIGFLQRLVYTQGSVGSHLMCFVKVDIPISGRCVDIVPTLQIFKKEDSKLSFQECYLMALLIIKTYC